MGSWEPDAVWEQTSPWIPLPHIAIRITLETQAHTHKRTHHDPSSSFNTHARGSTRAQSCAHSIPVTFLHPCVVILTALCPVSLLRCNHSVQEHDLKMGILTLIYLFIYFKKVHIHLEMVSLWNRQTRFCTEWHARTHTRTHTQAHILNLWITDWSLWSHILMNSWITNGLSFPFWTCADLCVLVSVCVCVCVYQRVYGEHSLPTLQFYVVVIYELPTKVSN